MPVHVCLILLLVDQLMRACTSLSAMRKLIRVYSQSSDGAAWRQTRL